MIYTDIEIKNYLFEGSSVFSLWCSHRRRLWWAVAGGGLWWVGAGWGRRLRCTLGSRVRYPHTGRHRWRAAGWCMSALGTGCRRHTTLCKESRNPTSSIRHQLQTGRKKMAKICEITEIFVGG